MGQLNIRRTMVKTAGVRLAVYPVTAICSLVGAAIVVRDVGPEAFGSIALVATLVLLLPFADLGLSAGLVNVFAREDSNSAEYVRVAWSMLWVACGVLIVGSTVVHYSVSWSKLIGTDNRYVPGWTILAVLVTIGLALPFGVGQRILIGKGEIALATVAQTAFSLVSVLFTWVAHVLDRPTLYVLVPSVAQFATALCLFVVGIGKSEVTLRAILRLGWGTRRMRRDLFSSGVPMLVIVSGLALAFQSDRLVLSHRSTPSELGAYSLGMTLYAPAWALVTTTGLHLWSHFAARREAATTDYWARWRDMSMLGMAGALALAALAPSVTRLWAGETIPFRLWVLFALLLLVQTLHLPAGMYLTDRDGLVFQAVSVVAMAVVNLSLSVALAPTLGAAGPLLASIVSVLTMQLLPGMWKVRRMLARRSLEAPGVGNVQSSDGNLIR